MSDQSDQSDQEEQLIRRAVQAWMRKAQDDVAQADHDLATDFDRYWVIAHHASRGAEKWIKAYLVRHQVEFRKVHDFEYLRELVQTIDADLAESLASADTLMPYSVKVGYPVQLTEESGVTRGDAVRATNIAKDVRRRLQQDLQAFVDIESEDPDIDEDDG